MKFGIPVVISNPARPRFKTGKIDFAVNKDYISFDWQGDLWALISKGKSGKREKPASNASWKSLTQADSVLPTNFLTNTEQRESWRRSERYWRRSRFCSVFQFRRRNPGVAWIEDYWSAKFLPPLPIDRRKATVAGSPRLQPPNSRGPSPPLTDARRPPLLRIKARCCYAAVAAARVTWFHRC